MYVGIDDPVEIRRSLLESSKNLIKILQENERRKLRREQKHQLVADLKESMNELFQLVTQLKSQMPKVKMSSLPKREVVKHTPIVPVAKTTEIKLLPKPKQVHLNETQKLEKELRDIEDKLNRLE